ncbi:predicted protein [Histoplasma capsulatum G186AR]|uniref:Uncharacterized protein n=1 Tax=Ajellomyces capsulatus (strain G186AR / H82 / ATCC MYA-2454 / RMSCC 2432) TaxID=447093 RepID=C0NQS2_AJECG|nr:uncharacterized protein HCBG_05352 [Histoplasma capsulatum G186AR]EEH06036.1 predicted protein [Histoplasma capsulatum G186AR]
MQFSIIDVNKEFPCSLQRYGPALNAKPIHPNPSMSLLTAIRDEPQFHLHFADFVLPHVRCGLYAGFEKPAQELPIQRLSTVALDGGGSAVFPNDRFPKLG